MTILVLGGGSSPEREVSSRSAAAVSEALRAAGFETIEADPKDGLAILDDLAPSTIVFPILHGAFGEDGRVQSELEKRNLPYLGTGSKASRICFDKNLTRQALEAAGLPIARGQQVTAQTYPDNHLRHQPHVLKAVGGGSSLGTLIVRNPDSFDASKFDEVFKVSDSAVVEELVEGVEITVPILDRSALPIIEIQPPEKGEFDYENKYNGKTKEICPPASINAESQKEAQALAEKVHQALGARHLSRVDMIIRPDGNIVVLEINTIPGMTNQSLYPKSAATSGISFIELMKEFVGLIQRDYKTEKV